MTNREKLRDEWTARIANYKASGLTMSAWCTTNYCTLHQLKYWLRKTKDMSSSAVPTLSTRFIPLAVADQPDTSVSSSVVVRIRQASIELQADFDPHLFRKIVLALEGLC